MISQTDLPLACGPYSSFDGTCHAKGNRNAVGEDFLFNLKTDLNDEKMLPNPRQISNELFSFKGDIPDPNGNSVLQPLFGQFLVHDIMYFGMDHSKPMYIDVPECDEHFDANCTGTQKLKFYKTKQKSNVTVWFDLSAVYGNSKEVAGIKEVFV